MRFSTGYEVMVDEIVFVEDEKVDGLNVYLFTSLKVFGLWK